MLKYLLVVLVTISISGCGDLAPKRNYYSHCQQRDSYDIQDVLDRLVDFENKVIKAHNNVVNTVDEQTDIIKDLRDRVKDLERKNK